MAMLQTLNNDNKIKEDHYRPLYPTSENTPSLYCTTKIHKEGNPIRSIMDYIGRIRCQTSKTLAEILSPLVGESEHHVKNSKQELSGVFAEEGEFSIATM